MLAGELHNNCLVVGVLSLVAAQQGDGIEAAAHTYFSKSASDLTLRWTGPDGN